VCVKVKGNYLLRRHSKIKMLWKLWVKVRPCLLAKNIMQWRMRLVKVAYKIARAGRLAELIDCTGMCRFDCSSIIEES